MGATFDGELLNRLGLLLGDEGRRKNVHLVLAPVVCIQRSPLLGRGFEAYGEDPVLSGMLASEFIKGIQERKVGACIKHYTAHDQSSRSKEDEIVMTERTLREIHLLPFQLAMKHSSPWAFMTAYQRINGVHASEDPFLINQVLRREWGFDGLVMSDWRGTYSTSKAINAGLDLEMPGPDVWRGKRLMEAVGCRKVSQKTIDQSVRRLLELIEPAEIPTETNQGCGNTVESRLLTRKAAADAIVLLKDERQLLPLKRDTKRRYGVIGVQAKDPATGGGGSSETAPWYISTPYDAICEMVSEDNVSYEPGCYGIHRACPYRNFR